MANLTTWFDIPAADFQRAVDFYSALFEGEMHKAEMNGVSMAFLPRERDEDIGGGIVYGEGYKPGSDGPVIYLNGGDDLSGMLSKVEGAGGKVIVPKTHINDEIGYFAMFIDSEGNRMALHSRN